MADKSDVKTTAKPPVAKRQSMTPAEAKKLGLDPSVYGKAGKS